MRPILLGYEILSPQYAHDVCPFCMFCQFLLNILLQAKHFQFNLSLPFLYSSIISICKLLSLHQWFIFCFVCIFDLIHLQGIWLFFMLDKNILLYIYPSSSTKSTCVIQSILFISNIFQPNFSSIIFFISSFVNLFEGSSFEHKLQ